MSRVGWGGSYSMEEGVSEETYRSKRSITK